MVNNFAILLFLISISVGVIIPESLEFKGYIHDNPCFMSYKDHNVYQVKGDSFSLVRNLPSKTSLLDVKDSVMLFRSENPNLDVYTLVQGTKETQFTNIHSSLMAGVDEDGHVFYTDAVDNLIKSPNAILDKFIRGYVLYCDREFIYYCRSDRRSIGPDAHVFRYNYKLNTIEYLVDHCGEEGMVFYRGKDIFYMERLMNGGFQPILFDIKKKSITTFDKVTQQLIEKSTPVFFDPSKDAFCGIKDGRVIVIKQF